LSTQDDDELRKHVSKINFGNREQVFKLASGAKVASLGLGEDEALLIQVPGAILNSSFFSCSQLRPLAATDLGTKKRKLEEESPSTHLLSNYL